MIAEELKRILSHFTFEWDSALAPIELRCNEPTHDNEWFDIDDNLAETVIAAEKHWKMHDE
jgi:hypothetical protein